jgi:hypothetical protein
LSEIKIFPPSGPSKCERDENPSRFLRAALFQMRRPFFLSPKKYLREESPSTFSSEALSLIVIPPSIESSDDSPGL